MKNQRGPLEDVQPRFGVASHANRKPSTASKSVPLRTTTIPTSFSSSSFSPLVSSLFIFVNKQTFESRYKVATVNTRGRAIQVCHLSRPFVLFCFHRRFLRIVILIPDLSKDVGYANSMSKPVRARISCRLVSSSIVSRKYVCMDIIFIVFITSKYVFYRVSPFSLWTLTSSSGSVYQSTWTSFER